MRKHGVTQAAEGPLRKSNFDIRGHRRAAAWKPVASLRYHSGGGSPTWGLLPKEV
jgi:hypothetical protein